MNNVNVQENTAGLTFTVPVELFSDTESGEQVILPSPRYITDIRRAAQILDTNAEKALESGTEEDKFRAQSIKATAASERDRADNYEAARERLLSHCDIREYKLTKPLNGAYIQALRKATKIDANGQQTIDNTILRDELLPKAIALDGQTVSVNTLEPVVADYLWSRLFNALRPSEDRLLFLSPRD